MSLDFYLNRDVSRFPIAADYLQDRGFDAEAEYLRSRLPEQFFYANITHNLNRMAEAAGLYGCLWRPEENGITHAHQMIEPLRAGLALLKSDPERFREYNPPNGWGDYGGLVAFVSEVLNACEVNPAATVEAFR